MGFKDILKSVGNKQRAKKELIRKAEEELRIQKLVEDRQKSANERELERFQKEEREEEIKKALEIARKKRDEDIKFGHNPLDIPNITRESDFSILKQRNLFKGKGNMFTGQRMIHKSNPKLLENNLRLLS